MKKVYVWQEGTYVGEEVVKARAKEGIDGSKPKRRWVDRILRAQEERGWPR